MPFSVPRDSPLGNMVPPAKVDALKEMSPPSAVLPVVSMPPLERLSNMVLQLCHDNNQNYDDWAAKIMKPHILDKYQRTKQRFELQLKSAKNILSIINYFEQYRVWLSELLRKMRNISFPSNTAVQTEAPTHFAEEEMSVQSVFKEDERHTKEIAVFGNNNEGIEADLDHGGDCFEGSDVPKSILENGRDDFAANSHKKAEKSAIIGKKGGDIELHGYKIAFPRNAVKEDIEFKVSIDDNPAHYPKDKFAITSILDVKPSMDFDKDVSVTMRTWFSAARGKQLEAQILHRSEEGEWLKDQDIKLTDKNEVTFPVRHFSGRVTVVDKESSDDTKPAVDGDAHFFNGVHMHRGTGAIISMICREEKALLASQAFFSDYGMVLVPPREIRGNLEHHFTIELDNIDPRTVKYLHKKKEGNPGAFIGHSALKKDLCFDFRPVNFPPNYKGSFMADYTVTVKGRDGEEDVQVDAVLSATFPMNLKVAGPVNVNVDQGNKIAANTYAEGGASVTTTEHRTNKSVHQA